MPKKVNTSSNQRIDLDDFTRAASDYTHESGNFDRQKLLLSDNSVVSGGFRIEVSDQASSPGEFTIFNGVAVDKSGNILNNEQQIADARTVTLSGAGLSFYVEIEFVESESDVDSRAFWDPTFSGNNPPGKEFSLSVATRVTPDWQVVQPVSTSAFSVTGDINSNRIPIGVLTTNGSNEITGFTAENAATVLAKDAGSLDTEIYVVDSLLFPTTGDATVGGTSVVITGNDRTNNILTLSAALGVTKTIGDIVVETVVTAAFVPQNKDSVPSSGADRRRRLFAGDEERGTALSQDPEDGAARSDVQIKSLKDHVDFLSSQIRELKFGNLRSGEDSNLPPSTFASTRHYDAAGSVTGARAHSITIGDGVLSFGDLNTVGSNLGTILQQAHDGLDATNGGSVFVKAGDYTWSTVFTSDRPIEIVFEEGALLSGVPTNLEIVVGSADRFTLRNFPAPPSGNSMDLSGNSSRHVELYDCHLRLDLNTGSRIIRARGCTFQGNGFDTALTITSLGAVGTNDITFEDCSILSDATSTQVALYLFQVADIAFRSCSFYADQGQVARVGANFTTDNVVFEDCTFESGDGAPTNGPTLLEVDCSNTSQEAPIVFRNCRVVIGDSSVAGTPAAEVLEFGSVGDSWIHVDGLHVEYNAATMTPKEVLTLRGYDYEGKDSIFRNITVNINGVGASSHTGAGMITMGTGTKVENFQLVDFANPSSALTDPVCSVIGDNIDIHGIKFRHDGVAGTLGWGYDGNLFVQGQFINIHDVYFENTLAQRSTAATNSGTFIQTLGAAAPSAGPIMIDGVFMPEGELWCPTDENLVIIGLSSERSTLKRFTGYLTVQVGSWDGPWIYINSEFCVVDSAVVQQTVQDGLETFVEFSATADYSAMTNCLLEANDGDSIFRIADIPAGANYIRINNNTALAQSGTASILDSGTGTVKIGNVLQ